MTTCNNCGRHKAEYDTRKGEESVCYFCEENAVTLNADEFICKKVKKSFKEDLIRKCNLTLSSVNNGLESCHWNTFDLSEKEEGLIKQKFYNELLEFLLSLETID